MKCICFFNLNDKNPAQNICYSLRGEKRSDMERIMVKSNLVHFYFSDTGQIGYLLNDTKVHNIYLNIYNDE